MAKKNNIRTLVMITAVTAGVALVIQIFGRRWLLKQFRITDENCLKDAKIQDLRKELTRRRIETREALKG